MDGEKVDEKIEARLAKKAKLANWVKPTVNESSLVYKFFKIEIGQDKDGGKWKWHVGDSIGEDGDGKSKDDVIRQAKSMIDSVTKDWD